MLEGWSVVSDVAVVDHPMNVLTGFVGCTVVQDVMHEVLIWERK